MATMTKPQVRNTDIKDMTFERALKELETIVGRLERGDVELEESIVIYERGEALKEHCDRLLKQAEARVEKLTLGPGGEPTGTEPFRPQE
jgi:exodeoxyribonuclease VII small subunit